MDKKPRLNKPALMATLIFAVLMLLVLFGTRESRQVSVEPATVDEVTVDQVTEQQVTEQQVTEQQVTEQQVTEQQVTEQQVTEQQVSEQQVSEDRTSVGQVSVEAEVVEQQSLEQVVVPELENEDYDWIAARIFENEAASQVRYLTYWGDGEDFPSFGIGHFIWFPTGVDAPFDEQFPDMVAYVSWHAGDDWPLPAWMLDLRPFDAPWSGKEVFDLAWSSEQMTQLRDWLQATARWQARFIVATFERRWQELDIPSDQKTQLTILLQQLAGSASGLFAIIDYYNFKGLGINPRERYQGQGWGLIQVLQEMPAYHLDWSTPSGEAAVENTALVEQFSQAAARRLSLRVELAPAERNENRWLPGWLKRLQGYLLNSEPQAE